MLIKQVTTLDHYLTWFILVLNKFSCQRKVNVLIKLTLLDSQAREINLKEILSLESLSNDSS